MFKRPDFRQVSPVVTILLSLFFIQAPGEAAAPSGGPILVPVGPRDAASDSGSPPAITAFTGCPVELVALPLAAILKGDKGSFGLIPSFNVPAPTPTPQEQRKLESARAAMAKPRSAIRPAPGPKTGADAKDALRCLSAPSQPGIDPAAWLGVEHTPRQETGPQTLSDLEKAKLAEKITQKKAPKEVGK